MKIAQIVCVYPPYAGGISNSASKVTKLLAGHHTIVNFTPTTLTPWLKYGHGAFLPQLLWRLRGFDYINLHYPFFGTAEVVWLFKLFCRKPKLIVHYHMDVKNLSLLARILSFPSRLIRYSLLKQAETIVTASLDYVEHSQIKKFYAAYPSKFKEIPFGLDLNEFQPKLINRDLGNGVLGKAKEIVHYINDHFIKRNRLNLLFVGALDSAHYFKGVAILLNALVVTTPRHWQLTIVGDGNLRPEYEALARELKIEKQVEFTGKLGGSDLVRQFQNADLFVLPSINSNEAFGIVLTEALACGVPVIASDLPGVRRVFTDHQEGLLITPGSVQDLKKKIEFILNNEELRRTMAVSARRLAEEKYDLSVMGHRLEELFT